jgi:hypothetical protein
MVQFWMLAPADPHTLSRTTVQFTTPALLMATTTKNERLSYEGSNQDPRIPQSHTQPNHSVIMLRHPCNTSQQMLFKR